VTSAHPLTGSPTVEVTFTGAHLDLVTRVSFAGTDLALGTWQADSATQLRARVPLRAATAGAFTLHSPQGPVTSPEFTPTFQPPVLEALPATSARVGATLVLAGQHLASTTTVTFGGAPATGITVVSPEQLQVVVPQGARQGPIRVTTLGGCVDSGTFRIAPSITSIQPTTGTPGTSVTIRGTGLGDGWNSHVRVGGSWVRFTVSANAEGTELVVAVPAGAPPGVLGPVTVLTQGGEAVSSEAFTLAYVPPPIPSLAPSHGVPGTEVTLEGPGLEGVTEVRFGGVPLLPGSWRLVKDGGSPAHLQARIPSNAPTLPAHPAFTLRNPAGQADSPGFTVTPLVSRVALLAGDLARRDLPWTMVDYPAVNRSSIYDLRLPVAPIFHAYHPFDNLRPGGWFSVKATLNLQLPEVFREILPAPVLAALAALPLPAAPLEILCVSQNQPYTVPMLFRPQYFLYPEAPTRGVPADDRARTAGMGLFGGPGAPPFHFQGHAAGAWLTGAATGTSVHAAGPAMDRPTAMICSPDNLQVAGLDPAQTRAVWSVVQDDLHPTHPGRTAVTLHLLLDDPDQEALAAVADSATTVQDLVAGMETFVPASPATEALKALVRPRLVSAVLGLPDAAGVRTLTLNGSSFTGVTAVTVDGFPVSGFHLVDDQRIDAVVPAGLDAAPHHGYAVRTLPFLEGAAIL